MDLSPRHINERLEIRHRKGDLMIGAGHKSAIGTIVELKSRFSFIIKLENKNAKNVRKKFIKHLNSLNFIFKKKQ